ncbi:MAG: hypothetical protein ACXACI_18200 [Candidatus Hodarchaeales archaeon]
MTTNHVEITVNGSSVAINAFVRRIFSNTVVGLISSLDGLPSEIETIEIRLKKKD